jgi:glycosyltransferase involved in cell wall biosynthesis
MANQEARGGAPALSIIIPAYNESAGIHDVIRGVQEVVQKNSLQAEILVVDDGSEDGTGKLAADLGAHVIRHHRNRGYGAALKTGILNAQHDSIVMMDADGTYPVETIPELLQHLENADMVVGARTSKQVRIPLFRRPAKWILNLLANYLSGTKIPDLNSGFRAFHRHTVLRYFSILPNRFSFTSTITLALLCDNYELKYIPINYHRRVGKSKIVPFDAMNFFMLILRTAMLFNPLRIFVPLALALALIGVGKGIFDVAKTGMLSFSAVFMLGSALQVMLIGMVGDALGRKISSADINSPFQRQPEKVEGISRNGESK